MLLANLPSFIFGLFLFAAPAGAAPRSCAQALNVRPPQLAWRKQGLLAGLGELRSFARSKQMRETARLIDLRRGEWATPELTHARSLGQSHAYAMDLDLRVIADANRTRRRLVLAHTHPALGVERTAAALRLDLAVARPFLEVWDALPSPNDVAADQLLWQTGLAVEQWVVSSRSVVAFAVNPDCPDAVALYRKMMNHVRVEVTRARAGDRPVDLSELIDVINAHPSRPVRLSVIKRF